MIFRAVHPRLLLLSAVLGGAVAAADSTQVAASLTLSDGQRMVQHWDAGPFAQTWNEPALAPLRQRFATEWPKLIETVGCDPLLVWRALLSAEGQLVVTDNPHAPFAPFGQANLGNQAASVFAALAKYGEPLAGTTADVAISLPNAHQPLQIQRRGDWLLLGPNAAQLKVKPTVANAHDVAFHLDGELLVEQIKDELEVRDLMAQILPEVDATFDLIPRGFSLSADFKAAGHGLIPFDQNLLRRVPLQATEVAAIGLAGDALWAAIGKQCEQIRLKHNPNSGDQPLEALGIQMSLAEVISGLSGTWMMVGTPSMPIPGYTLLVPRTAFTDQVVAALVAKTASNLPEVGQSLPIPLPGRIPIALSLGRDASHWIVSTDPAFADGWLANHDGTWLNSPLGQLAQAKLSPTMIALSLSDTRVQLQQAASSLAMMGAAIPNVTPEERQAIAQFFTKLSTRVDPGWSTLARQGNQLHYASEGLSSGNSSIASVAIIAGMTLPAIHQVRVSAQRARSGTNMRQLVLGAQVYANDNDREFPPDLSKLIEISGGELTDKNLINPGAPTRKDTYLYVRPNPDAKPRQPMIIEDPGVWKNTGCNVVFADGHIEWIKQPAADRIWKTAQELSGNPKSLAQGLDLEDWAEVKDLLAP